MGLEEYVKQADGKPFVICVDKFSYEDFFQGTYKTPEAALSAARKATKEAMGLASDSSIATVYYAYDGKGRYLGGDTWNNE